MAKYTLVTSVTFLLVACLMVYAYNGGEELCLKLTAFYSLFHRASEVAATVVAVVLILTAILIVGAIFVCFLIILSVLEIIFRPQVAILGVRPRFARIFFGDLGSKYEGLR